MNTFRYLFQDIFIILAETLNVCISKVESFISVIGIFFHKPFPVLRLPLPKLSLLLHGKQKIRIYFILRVEEEGNRKRIEEDKYFLDFSNCAFVNREGCLTQVTKVS